MKLLFTLCGRAGSKGVKNKNILDFCGVPLPFYSLAAIQLYQQKHTAALDCGDIALSTDSPELIKMIRSVSPNVLCIDRDKSLAGDAIRKIDVIRDATLRIEQQKGFSYDAVVDLDITSPLRRLEDLEQVIQKRQQVDADVVYTVTESRRNPYFNMVMKHETGYYSTVLSGNFSARQQTPAMYDMNASIYAYSKGFIHDTEPLFKRADIVVMKDTGILDIDSTEDYELLGVIAQYLFENDPSYAAIAARAKAY